LSNRSDGAPRWITNDLVVNVSNCSGSCDAIDYYDALSGKLLAAAKKTPEFDSPQLSPNKRWLVSVDIETLKYVMTDLRTGAEVEIADASLHTLDFLGWTDDSMGFFAIKREYDLLGTSDDV